MNGEALRDAICDGDLELVRKLVEEEGVSINYIDADDGWPLLLWAVKTHHIECLQYLLIRGSNVHIGDALGNTALHKAAYLGHEDCVLLLLSHGARLNTQNLNHQTPLDLAELFDRKEMIQMLQAMQTQP